MVVFMHKIVQFWLFQENDYFTDGSYRVTKWYYSVIIRIAYQNHFSGYSVTQYCNEIMIMTIIQLPRNRKLLSVTPPHQKNKTKQNSGCLSLILLMFISVYAHTSIPAVNVLLTNLGQRGKLNHWLLIYYELFTSQ